MQGEGGKGCFGTGTSHAGTAWSACMLALGGAGSKGDF